MRKNLISDLEKIGICGIPSLWISRDELIQKGHVYKEHLEENDRLELMLRILHSHKKYENDKYFGGSIFKRGSQAHNPLAQGSQAIQQQTANQTIQVPINGTMAGIEYVWFSTDNLVRLKYSQQNQGGNEKGKEDVELQIQMLPHINRGGYDQSDALTFKILQAEAKLVRLILESHSFQQTDQNDWNLLWTCTSSQQKQYIYENLHEYQKINHFVSASELTRKDRLCYNVGKMQQKFGKQNFDFLPETYILPDEYSEFQKTFSTRQQLLQEGHEDAKNLWIIKPQTSSQGKGIYMVDDISEVPQNEPLVISRYIENPLLINGLKFDLRLYVLVTNFDPLKIYVYNEGLVRFASEPYNIESIKSNVYAHLTNYSINKKSENFVQNQNISERDFGNKWSLSALQNHLERLGIDMKLMWARIYDAIIKSIISIENQVVQSIKKVQNNSGSSIKSNCFDLFGFDIILDSDLKPWILEVNLSPSLAFDSPLDFHIKSNLIVDVLNVVGIRKVNRKKEGASKHGGKKQTSNNQGSVQQSNISTQASTTTGSTQGDQRKRQNTLSANPLNSSSQSQLKNLDTIQSSEQASGVVKSQSTMNAASGGGFNIDISLMDRLSKISAKHRELLREHLEEFCMMRHCINPVSINQASVQPKYRRHNFTRIFPGPGTNSYDQYFALESNQQSSNQQPSQKQWNKILYRYLYDKTSELQDIINQVQRQNRHLIDQQHRRASQVRIASQTQSGSDTKSPSKMQIEDQQQERHDQANLIEEQTAVEKTEQQIVAGQSSQIKLPQVPRSQSQIQKNIIAQNIQSNITDFEQGPTITISGNQKSVAESSLSPVHNSASKKIPVVSQTTVKESLNLKIIDGQESQNKNSQPKNQTLFQSVENMNNGGRAAPLQQNLKSAATVSVSIDKLNKINSGEASTSSGSGIIQGQQQKSKDQSSAPAQAVDTRIVVTGDDILIEYVRRIMILCKQCHMQSIELSQQVQRKLEQFITHKIWLPKDEKKQTPSQQFQNIHAITGPSLHLWQKMEGRFNEMGERKRRLFIKKHQSENKKSGDISPEYIDRLFRQQEKQKSDIVKDFSSSELELMLMQSNKNNPIEVVTILLTLNPSINGGSHSSHSNNYNSTHGGVLTQIEHDQHRFAKSGSQIVRNKTNDGLATTIQYNSLPFDNGNQAEKSFDLKDLQGGNMYQAYSLSNHTYSSSNDRHANGAGYQSTIASRLRQSDDQFLQQIGQTAPNGSNYHSRVNYQSKDGSQGTSATLSQTTQHNTGILGIQGASSIHNSVGQHGVSIVTQGSTVASHASLMTNLNGNKKAMVAIQELHANQKSNSKIKNQALFDRSDIALQTGLALTHHKLSGGTTIANNPDLQKKITLPQINNLNQGTSGGAGAAGGAATGGATLALITTGNTGGNSTSVVSNKGGVHPMLGNSKYPSVSTQGLAMQAQSLQSAYLQHQTLQNFLTSIGGEGSLGGNALASQALSNSTSNSQNENTSKYRQNKMTGVMSSNQHSTSKTPGGPQQFETNSTSSKYTSGNPLTTQSMKGTMGAASSTINSTNLNQSLIAQFNSQGSAAANVTSPASLALNVGTGIDTAKGSSMNLNGGLKNI